MQVVPVNEFLNYLKVNGLVIGKAEDFIGEREWQLQEQRAKLKKLKAATFKQVLDANILPVKSKTALNYWIAEGKFKTGETYKCAKSKKLMILTSALVRMGFL